MTDQELLDFADKAKEKAYAPYSRFQEQQFLPKKEKYSPGVMWRILLMEQPFVQREQRQSKLSVKDIMTLK